MVDIGEKHGRTLFVRNIPYSATNEGLENVFSDVGPIKSCFVVKDKESGKCRGFGYVKFTLLEDAEKALKTVTKIDGRHVHIVYANKKDKKKFGQPINEKTADNIQEKVQDKNKHNKKNKKGQVPVKGQKQAPNPLNEGKRARLIIRNLAFRCTNKEIVKAFEKYGDVVDVHIPKKACGTRLGFGFVQFKNRAQAGMAVKEINGKEICGRVVAVDWALPKDKFESQLAAKVPAKEYIEVKEHLQHGEDMEVDDGDDDEDSNEDNDKKEPDEENRNIIEDSSSEEEEEEENSETDSDSGNDEDEKASSDEDEKASSDENEKASSDEDDDSDIENDTSHKNNLPPIERESDVNEGRTVFIRNLPYAVESEELEEFFSQFGAVKYVRVVVDKNSGMPKGSAFVQFQSKEAAESCMETASKGEDSGLSLSGRNLLLNFAVSRNQAGEFTQKDKKKEQKDTRNLYLAREGMIRPGTAAAKDVPATDLALRSKIDAAKRSKLKDQNVFVSSTRLCVHNIPPIITDKKLRQIVVKAAGAKEAKLVECRIMRDLNRLNSQGVGKSRGYAFCAFTQHEHALSALKNLNNNPDIFGDKKRLIVEFSLENRKALEAKQKRLEKSKAKLAQQKQVSQNTGAPKDNTINTQKRKKKNKGNGTNFAPLAAKKEQDKVARSLHKGPLGLPSHSGPKQRHKQRPSQQGKDRKKTNLMEMRNNNTTYKRQQPLTQKLPKERPMKMKISNKRKNNTDNFEKLVAAHKQKILSSVNF